MDTQAHHFLVYLIRTQRTALGTLDEGAPLVSLVLYLPNATLQAVAVAQPATDAGEGS
ncbi:MAG: hypothetical protein R3E79_26725 [Caldilineaceae bacterium]